MPLARLKKTTKKRGLKDLTREQLDAIIAKIEQAHKKVVPAIPLSFCIHEPCARYFISRRFVTVKSGRVTG